MARVSPAAPAASTLVTTAAPSARDLRAPIEPRRPPPSGAQSMLVLKPAERRVYQALQQAVGQPLPIAKVQEALDGISNPDRFSNAVRAVGKVMMALKPLGQQVIRSSGKGPTLSYCLVDRPPTADPATQERWRDAELVRMYRCRIGAERIAEALGFDNRNAVLGRLAVLRNTAAPADQPVRSLPPSDRPIGITLAPCGYAAWSFDPAGGDHVVRFQGEEDPRVLSRLDREMNRLTTERAQVRRAPSEGDDA